MKNNKMKSTAADYEILMSELKMVKKKLEVTEEALENILTWQENPDAYWDYPETIASEALEKLAKLDGF